MSLNEKDAKLLMDSVQSQGAEDTSALQLDSVTEMGDKLRSLDKNVGVATIRKTILDSVNAYKTMHGCNPSPSLVAVAMDHAKLMLDDAVGEGSSIAQNSRGLVPMQPMLAIRSMISGAVPFAHYIQTDRVTGEAPLIIVSHNAGAKTGRYADGDSLNGLGGGESYILSERTHTLTSSDRTTFAGKITPVMTAELTCDQTATVHPLYDNRTQFFVNGLQVAVSRGNGADEGATGQVKLGSKTISFTAKVNINTAETSVVFAEAVPENTLVFVRGFLNLEHKGLTTPSVVVKARKYTMHAQNYRAKVLVTPEAKVQFAKEMGLDPSFEGTMVIRQQFSAEIMYNILHRLSIIGQFTNQSTYDFNWATFGQEKTQAQIAIELIGQINLVSQEMANANGSHGVSHIYVGDTMRAILLSLGRDYFEPAEINAVRPGAYRLGRLAGQYEVYYTPKGIVKGAVQGADRMLLIGANAAQPAFNPVILGEASAPNIASISETQNDPDTGYWVTGKNFIEQNPVDLYAQSVAVIDVINTAYKAK